MASLTGGGRVSRREDRKVQLAWRRDRKYGDHGDLVPPDQKIEDADQPFM